VHCKITAELAEIAESQVALRVPRALRLILKRALGFHSGVLMRALVLCLCVVLSTGAAMARQAEQPPGKIPYDRVCRVCHGEDARGDAGPRLVPFGMEYDELIAKVREGGSEMPPISTTTVSDDEVRQILAYLKSLSPPADPANASHRIAPL
jgi:mono/diheme cytochrome c family protein